LGHRSSTTPLTSFAKSGIINSSLKECMVLGYNEINAFAIVDSAANQR
jgi:hypothetical protein